MQSAPSAEWAAYGVACHLFVEEATLHLDCLSVLSMLEGPGGVQLSPKHEHAGYIRASWLEQGRQLIRGLEKVKTHVEWQGSDLTGAKLAHAKGNDEADVAAKLGAEVHFLKGETLADEADQLFATALKVLDLAARLLPLWPSCTGPRAQKAPKEGRAQAVARLQGLAHKWTRVHWGVAMYCLLGHGVL